MMNQRLPNPAIGGELDNVLRKITRSDLVTLDLL